MAKGKSKDVEKKQDALIVQDEQLFGGADAAMDDMSREDVAIPRLTVLQSNSPQVDKHDQAHVPGSEPGMIFDIVNGKMFDGEEGVVIVPLNFRKTFIEWVLREKGGGFVADHGAADGEELLKTATRDDKGRDMLPNGNQLVRTMEYVVYHLSAEGYSPAIIAMASTQIKYAMRWNTQLGQARLSSGQPAPIFYRAWNVSTQPEKNDKGSWFSWHVQVAAKVTELDYPWLKDKGEFVQQCKNFRELVKSGALRFSPPPSQGGEADADPEAM